MHTFTHLITNYFNGETSLNSTPQTVCEVCDSFVNRKCILDFLLVINCECRCYTVVEMEQRINMSNVTHDLTFSFQWMSFEFHHETYHAIRSDITLVYTQNRILLVSAVRYNVQNIDDRVVN